MTKEPSLSKTFFQKLPKTDLHCHLDGSLRLETLIDLARQHKVSLPSLTPKELSETLGIGGRRAHLEDYLDAFQYTCAVLQTEDAIERVAFELLEDCFHDGVWYVEIRFCPALHIENGVSQRKVIEAVFRGAEKAKSKYGVAFGLIICAIRTFAEEQNLEITKVACASLDCGVVALDIAGAEKGYPAKNYADLFELARKSLLHTTVHAGEAYGPDSIKQALYACAAERIGHGTTLFEHPELMNYVKDRRIPIESCPTSNVNTGVVKSLREHPFKDYLKAGLRITLNTDNRLMSQVTMTDEFFNVYHRMGVPFEDIKRVIRNGFKSAFLPYEKRQDLLTRAKKRIGELESSMVS